MPDVGGPGPLSPERDPASPSYAFSPERESLREISPDSITTPGIIPPLPGFIAFFTGANGVLGRESFYVSALRHRCSLAGRAVSPVELAVLSRYTRNIQYGTEWFGFLGIVAMTVQGYRSQKWPLEEFWKNVFGVGSNKPPPSGFVMPHGWGQDAGSAPASSSTGSANHHPSPTSTSSPPPTLSPKPNTPTLEGRPFASRMLVQVATSGAAPAILLKLEAQMKEAASAYPEDQRNGLIYKTYKRLYDRIFMLNRRLERVGKLATQGFIAKLKEDAVRYEELAKRGEKGTAFYVNGAKEARSLLKEIEEIEAKKAANAASAPAPAATGSTATEAKPEAKPEAKFEAKTEAKPEAKFTGQQSNFRPPIRELPRENSNFFLMKDALRMATWGYMGKLFFGSLGIAYMTMRSRSYEQKDERLQEYNYDRMQYARAKIQNAADQRASVPVPSRPSYPPPSSQESSGGRSETDDSRFQEEDTQSLGGLQTEALDWSGIQREDEPTGVPAAGRVPPSGPQESAWERAKRARDGPRQPAMEEDRWAPQVQQDRAPSTPDMDSLSTWEKIRQRGSEGYSGQKRVPGEARDSDKSGDSSFSSKSAFRQDNEGPKTKEDLQREFDAQLEKERQGEADSWK
ncbi:hypothetical protein ABW20_dc0108536 [Dactylellina cionopaga]|nr:hypothetical protein ABW20_dc0108536 [Dactylellina cionopaga]